MPTFSSFVLDADVRGIRVFRVSFNNEKDIVLYLPEITSFKSSYPVDWDSLSASSRSYYLNNHPNNNIRFFLEVSSFPFNLVNSSFLNYAINKVYLGSLIVGVRYGDAKYFVIDEVALERAYLFPFGLRTFVTDIVVDIHALTFINLQFKVPVTGYLDLVTVFNIPSF
jgi:hypothetical protein